MLSRLLAVALPGHWTETMLRSDIVQPASHYYLAWAKTGEAVGFGGFWLIEDEAHLVVLAVEPACRQRGVGTALLWGLLQWAREQGARRMTLEVRADNEAALALYRRFGFVELGRRPGYYGEVDGLVLWTPRIDGPDYAGQLQQWAAGWRRP